MIINNYKLKPNKVLSVWIFGIVILTLQNCSLCKDCGGNKLEPIINNLPYINNQQIKFQYQDSIMIDTFSYQYNVPSDQYYCSGKENPSECAGSLNLKIGDFNINYEQGGYYMKGLYGPYCSTMDGYYNIKDSVDYNYKGTIIKAYHYLIDTTRLKNKDIYHYDFYINTTNRLLKFQIKRNDKFEEWIEKE